MSPFTVLTDTDVQTLLRNTNHDDISNYANILTKTLQDYSTKNESEYQPHRAAVTRPTGQNTLFMPSTSPSTIGVKVVGIPAPPSTSSTSSSTTNTTSTSTATAKPTSSKPPTLEVTLTICTATGRAQGVLNAAELTAFRTSLGAMLLFRKRKIVSNIVMFGSGKQAFWHVRLALLLRGKDIARLTVVNRSRGRAEELLASLKADDVLVRNSHVQLELLVTGENGGEERLREVVRTANSIHCAVPSTVPLFPAAWLMDDGGVGSGSNGFRRDLYVSAIGSYRLDMRELDPELLTQIVRSSGGFVPEGCQSPVIVVDSRSGCFQEAGELVAADLKGKELLEIGELSEMIERDQEAGGLRNQGLEDWLASGLLVYKSVGVGVMDISIGSALIDQARKQGVGINVENF